MTPHQTIGDLSDDGSLLGVRFIYPGDGKAYYWYSQWVKGVWGKKDMEDGRVYPLHVVDLQETLTWKLAPNPNP